MMTTRCDWSHMTDEQFNKQVLQPALAEARRRKFTVRLDPFSLLRPRRALAFQDPPWPSPRKKQRA